MGRYINIDDNGNIRGFDIARTGYSLVYVENWQSDYYVKPIVNKIDNVWQIVETATQEEIDAYNNSKQEALFDSFMQKKLDDGKSYYDKKNKEITMQLFGRSADEVDPIVTELEKSVDPILTKIQTGNWYTAKKLELPLPTIQEVIDIYNVIINDVEKYVKENY